LNLSVPLLNVPPKHPIVSAAKAVVTALSAIRLTPHIALFLCSSKPKRRLLWQDLDRYGKVYRGRAPRTGGERVALFIEMMTYYSEYRNVFYLRHKTFSYPLSLLCRPMKSLSIDVGTCGPGLFIQHGVGTLVSAHAVGANCTISQLVTIGYEDTKTDRPTLGDNVTVAVGARVLGGIIIGDNATVSANSVVIHNVEANTTVMGVPAKILWTKNLGVFPGSRPSTICLASARDGSRLQD
jgi:serine O-acetyltransferase